MSITAWVLIGIFALVVCWMMENAVNEQIRKRVAEMTDDELDDELEEVPEWADSPSYHQMLTDEHKRRQLAKRVKEAA